MTTQLRNARALLGALAFAAGMAGATGCSRAPTATALAASEGLTITELPDLPGCETFAHAAPKGTVEVTPLRDYTELYFIADSSGGRCIDTLDGLTHALSRWPDTVTVHRARVLSPTRTEQASSNPMPGTDPDPYASNPMPGSDPSTDPYASNPMPGSDRSDR